MWNEVSKFIQENWWWSLVVSAFVGAFASESLSLIRPWFWGKIQAFRSNRSENAARRRISNLIDKKERLEAYRTQPDLLEYRFRQDYIAMFRHLLLNISGVALALMVILPIVFSLMLPFPRFDLTNLEYQIMFWVLQYLLYLGLIYLFLLCFPIYLGHLITRNEVYDFDETVRKINREIEALRTKFDIQDS